MFWHKFDLIYAFFKELNNYAPLKQKNYTILRTYSFFRSCRDLQPSAASYSRFIVIPYSSPTCLILVSNSFHICVTPISYFLLVSCSYSAYSVCLLLVSCSYHPCIIHVSYSSHICLIFSHINLIIVS